MLEEEGGEGPGAVGDVLRGEVGVWDPDDHTVCLLPSSEDPIDETLERVWELLEMKVSPRTSCVSWCNGRLDCGNAVDSTDPRDAACVGGDDGCSGSGDDDDGGDDCERAER